MTSSSQVTRIAYTSTGRVSKRGAVSLVADMSAPEHMAAAVSELEQATAKHLPLSLVWDELLFAEAMACTEPVNPKPVRSSKPWAGWTVAKAKVGVNGSWCQAVFVPEVGPIALAKLEQAHKLRPTAEWTVIPEGKALKIRWATGQLRLLSRV